MVSPFNPRKVRYWRAGALLLLSILCSLPIQAQVVGGTISGTVSDKSGAVVANATVSLTNLATGVTTAVTTNAQGLYSVPNLLPGDYQEKVSDPKSARESSRGR